MECVGNIYHACGTKLIENQTVLIEFVKCWFSDRARAKVEPYQVAMRCLDEVKRSHNELTLSWERLHTCATGREGQELHAEAGVRTKALCPPMSTIPTVEINGSQQG